MQEWHKGVREMIEAAESLLTALSAQNLESVEKASRISHALFKKWSPLLPKDLDAISDVNERKRFQEDCRRLKDLNTICLNWAQVLERGVGADLIELKNIRQAVDAALSNVQAPSSTVDQHA